MLMKNQRIIKESAKNKKTHMIEFEEKNNDAQIKNGC